MLMWISLTVQADEYCQRPVTVSSCVYFNFVHFVRSGQNYFFDFFLHLQNCNAFLFLQFLGPSPSYSFNLAHNFRYRLQFGNSVIFFAPSQHPNVYITITYSLVRASCSPYLIILHFLTVAVLPDHYNLITCFYNVMHSSVQYFSRCRSVTLCILQSNISHGALL